MPLFRQHFRQISPINVNYWAFAIGGAVRHPLILSYADLLALPVVEVGCTIACAGHSPDQPLLGDGLWSGVPLSALLAEVDIDPAAQFARVHSYDGYSAVLMLDRLRDSLLALTLDGEPLPHDHGFPARLIARGQGGYKLPKWVTRVELTGSADGGFWESRGLPIDGAVTPVAAILDHTPTGSGSIRLSGAAYAGEQAITRIEIRIDGGDPMPVPFEPDEPSRWTRWQIDWTPPAPGDYAVQVSAFAEGRPTALPAQHTIVIRHRA